MSLKQQYGVILFFIILAILTISINIGVYNIRDSQYRNHRETLSLIERQIDTQTEFINALRECLEGE